MGAEEEEGVAAEVILLGPSVAAAVDSGEAGLPRVGPSADDPAWRSGAVRIIPDRIDLGTIRIVTAATAAVVTAMGGEATGVAITGMAGGTRTTGSIPIMDMTIQTTDTTTIPIRELPTMATAIPIR